MNFATQASVNAPATIRELARRMRARNIIPELELFDLLKKDKMTNEETQKVRLAAKSLLHRLREESPKVLVQDWFKDGQSKLRVRSAVEMVLHTHLPESYDRVVFTPAQTRTDPSDGVYPRRMSGAAAHAGPNRAPVPPRGST